MEPPIELSNSVRYHMSFIESMHCNTSKKFFLLFSEAVKSFGQTVDWLMSWLETLSVVMREIAGRMSKTGVILGLRPANERCRYTVTLSLIGWMQT